jgi:hypothetical protein
LTRSGRGTIAEANLVTAKSGQLRPHPSPDRRNIQQGDAPRLAARVLPMRHAALHGKWLAKFIVVMFIELNNN